MTITTDSSEQKLDKKMEDIERSLPKQKKSHFKPLLVNELLEILGLTIKRDKINKLVTFLCMLAAYTENSQFNISYNAPSSTGKSYIPLELAQLFPQTDVIKTGYASPTAFFHDRGEYIKDLQGYEIDLERKILIFLDQPHSLLLQHLRPVLSHDEKNILIKITDKTQKRGLKTKNILIKGFSSVIFCTAGLKIDEQEATRMVLLSPETTQEKIREAIFGKVKKDSDPESYHSWLEEDTRRKELKQRIEAIRSANIRHVIISRPERIYDRFLSMHKFLKPRHARDIGRLMSIIKSLALLNLWHREARNGDILATEKDAQEAFKIWDKLSVSQELGIPPYIYKLYQEVVLSAWENNEQSGLERKDIIQKHSQVYGRPLSEWHLRQQIIPMLETAGLITQEPADYDKRKMLIFPTTPHNTSSDKNNSV